MRIAVVGCGPAGLAAALILRRAGHDVTALERFDAPAPVGSGLMLQPTGLAVLQALGLAPQVLAGGHGIDRLYGVVMPSERTVLDVGYAALGSDRFGLAVHRSTLFDALYAAALDANVRVQTATDVTGLRQSADGASLQTGDGEHGPYDLVIDAAGAASPLAESLNGRPRRLLDYGAIWATLDWPAGRFPERTLSQRYVGAHTMIGVLPLGRPTGTDRDKAAFFWSLRHKEFDRWRDAGLDAWKSEVLAIWPDTDVLLEQIDDPAQMTLATYGHHTLRRPVGQRLAVIGDAAHSTSPQLGQGANMALLDAWALGLAIDQAEDVSAALHYYAALRRWHVRLFQFASLSLTGFYQSDSRMLAGLRDALFAPLAKLPGVRRLVAGLVSGLLLDPLGKLWLEDADTAHLE